MEEQIGKGTWIDKVADILIKREKKLGRSLDLIRVESGLGASGIPHIGSMGDAVRAYGIALALQNFGFKSELVAYSDDMDGLRKIPHGLPDWLQEHIARPVSSIPDPFGSCHASYGAHMSSLLLDGLDKAGIKYRFQSGREAYKQGLLVNQIDTILKSSAKLGQKIAEFVGQDKYIEVLPYFPVCHNCGRLYTAVAQKYLPDEKKVTYVCSGSRIGKADVKGCGHRGEADIAKGEGKLAWKVEFGARWAAFDIRFEAYGKDIMDSVRVNDWVADEILGYAHPLHVKYEMFLDKSGKKISKSAGNVLTPQMWLRYGTPESILLLLFKRITGTRHVGLDDVPVLMKEYDDLEDIYFGRVKVDNPAKLVKDRGLYEYINKLQPPKQPGPHVSYQLIAQQAAIFPSGEEDRYDKIFNRLVTYNIAKDKTDAIMQKIRLASNWADDNMAREEKFDIKLSDAQRKAIIDLIEAIKPFAGMQSTPDNAKELQSKVFDVARNNGMEPKEFFTLLYRMFLNADRGPRIGNYFLDLGIDRAISVLQRYL
ncbi:lysine--tRNA ligase [Candidatus Nitrososphaera gargensis Ga9.2]|uniref:Lysine--tRNA ligase n=1 Tax=Nitrososphaera gargensis (strain Ga9.2) TaxID=1237085 RepID=K0IEV0_NITGG|nr:lysine--tRNA ligase [Candidatus Nitrososphaera gargensis]AFU57323.1 lysine--tRNA ligase [Candidatus Nitrososphaera gargensis Ga9.2]